MSYFKMHRGWQDSDCFGNEQYSDRDAWVWMVGEAEWKDTTVNILGKPTPLKRGQFSSSVRFMAKKFLWSTGRIQRFIKKLKNWGMIESETDTGQFIITICNYSKYQGGDTAADTQVDTLPATPPDTHTDTNTKNLKKEKKVKKRECADALVKPESVSLEVWRDFKKQRKTPLTPTALAGIEKEAQKAGWPLERALAHAVVRGWQSFEADWVTKENGNGRNTERKQKYTADDALRDVIDEIRADSPSGPPELCNPGHLRQITGGAEISHAGDDRRPPGLLSRGN
jgi:hypothetical protein